METWTLSHFENRCYVTEYFVTGRTEAGALFSVSEKICVLLQENAIKPGLYLVPTHSPRQVNFALGW